MPPAPSPPAPSTAWPLRARPRFRKAAQVITGGGVIAYPTEGVYGLGCRPDDGAAVQRILAIKGRPESAGLILIAASLAQLAAWIAPTPAEAARLAAAALDRRAANNRPVTWVVTASPHVPAWITGGRATLAVRVTRHPVAAALCEAAGTALVSTSANRHGRQPTRTALAARQHFRNVIDLVVGGQIGGARGPSEIRNARTGEVLRAG